MRFTHVRIASLAHVVPETAIRTAMIERMLAPTLTRLRIPAGTLESMTGVETRGFWSESMRPSDAATQAATKALAAGPVSAEQIDALISTSVSKDYLEPSVAALVHGNLGLAPHALNFDIGNACLGFLSGMTVAASLIDAGRIRSALVVAGESSREVTMATAKTLLGPNATFQDFRDNLATLTLGSAGVAMVLAHQDLAPEGPALTGSVAQAGTAHSRLCLGTPTGMITDAPKLLAEGVALAQRTWAEAQAELGVHTGNIAHYALHQVGRANHDAVIGALGIDGDRAPALFPQWGNVGAAGVPLTLSTRAEAGDYQRGDRVMLMGIGSGLNVQMMELQW